MFLIVWHTMERHYRINAQLSNRKDHLLGGILTANTNACCLSFGDGYRTAMLRTGKTIDSNNVAAALALTCGTLVHL